MPTEVVVALLSVIVGGVIATGGAYWLDRRQRKEAEQDWHRDNQRDIDWQAQDFVIEVQAFAFDPKIQTVRHDRDPRTLRDTTTSHMVFNRARGAELIAKANAFEARVQDPELKEHIRSLHNELIPAHHFKVFSDDRLATIFIQCQKFNDRMAELYGGPSPKSMQEQLPKLEYSASPEPVVMQRTDDSEKAANPPVDTQDTSP